MQDAISLQSTTEKFNKSTIYIDPLKINNFNSFLSTIYNIFWPTIVYKPKCGPNLQSTFRTGRYCNLYLQTADHQVSRPIIDYTLIPVGQKTNSWLSSLSGTFIYFLSQLKVELMNLLDIKILRCELL